MHSNQYDVTLVQSIPNSMKHTDSRTDINSNSLKYKYKSYGLYYGFELKSYGTRQMSVCLLGKGPSVQLLLGKGPSVPVTVPCNIYSSHLIHFKMCYVNQVLVYCNDPPNAHLSKLAYGHIRTTLRDSKSNKNVNTMKGTKWWSHRGKFATREP
uniref:Uncharacterized protein n=1 Tax=Cacopsylla melanoneura TaxID=428564 RepID=A0A8D8RCN7_9HEMI